MNETFYSGEQVAGLMADLDAARLALTRANETNDMLRTMNDRLSKRLLLVRAEIARVGLVAEKDW